MARQGRSEAIGSFDKNHYSLYYSSCQQKRVSPFAGGSLLVRYAAIRVGFRPLSCHAGTAICLYGTKAVFLEHGQIHLSCAEHREYSTYRKERTEGDPFTLERKFAERKQ